MDRWLVALRKESVDRNYWWVEGDRFFYVALRKESVDRNQHRTGEFNGVH